MAQKKIEDNRELLRFMTDFWRQYAMIEDNFSKELKRLAESSVAKFESNVLVKFLMSKVANTKTIDLSPSFVSAWNSLRSQLMEKSAIHQKISADIEKNTLAPLVQYVEKKDLRLRQVSETLSFWV